MTSSKSDKPPILFKDCELRMDESGMYIVARHPCSLWQRLFGHVYYETIRVKPNGK